MKRVTGIGGIFFKSRNQKELKDWYTKHLGIESDEYGKLFESRDVDYPQQKTYLQWSIFKDNTDYFHPSEKEFMINYRVENLEQMLDELAAEGVTILGNLESYDYGKFAHIIDPEGNKIELWESVDKVFNKEDEGNNS